LVTVTAQLIIYCLATYQYYSKVCWVPDATWAGTIYTAFSCSPWLSWFSSLALLFLLWVTALLVMQLNQIVLMGVTTNEFYNVARYNYLQSDCVGCTKVHSPFSFGWKQNISDFLEYKLPCLPSPQRYNWFTLYSWGSVSTPRPQSPSSKLKRSVSLSSIVWTKCWETFSELCISWNARAIGLRQWLHVNLWICNLMDCIVQGLGKMWMLDVPSVCQRHY